VRVIQACFQGRAPIEGPLGLGGEAPKKKVSREGGGGGISEKGYNHERLRVGDRRRRRDILHTLVITVLFRQRVVALIKMRARLWRRFARYKRKI